ncbi:MAG: polysaccharide deacetylase family protein [Chloroflexota bacterium]|nr:polysaccharide deacetylase family protein [Chloroflexota bacterium]
MNPINADYFELEDPSGLSLAGLLVLLDRNGRPLRADLYVAADVPNSDVNESVHQARQLLDQRYAPPVGETLPLYVLRANLHDVINIAVSPGQPAPLQDEFETRNMMAAAPATSGPAPRPAKPPWKEHPLTTYLLWGALIVLTGLALLLAAQMVSSIKDYLDSDSTSTSSLMIEQSSAQHALAAIATTPTPEPTVPSLDVPDSYCLWPNDTISEIAYNANVSEEAILKANPGWTGQAGSTIQLPRDSTPPRDWTAPLPQVDSVEDLPFGISGYYIGRDNRQKRVALSFDIGFVEGNRELMEQLAARGIRATFFVLGGAVENHPEMIAPILENGHELGNHSYTHENMLAMTTDAVAQELAVTEQFVQAAYPGATTKPIFRAPFGAINDSIVSRAKGEGYHIIGWTVDSRDWTDEITPESLYDRVTELVCPGAIIAMHDVNPANQAALPRLLDFLEGSGYEFVTISEILFS